MKQRFTLTPSGQCPDCDAPLWHAQACNDGVNRCAPCAAARELAADKAAAVAGAQEIIRWRHHTLNGYAIPPRFGTEPI